VVIGPSVAEAVSSAAAAGELGQTVAEAFAGARAYPDGRWLWLPIEDDTTSEGVRRLVAMKSLPPRRVRRVR
jgi:hypothetical protein